MCKFNMFITAVCVLFLIKLRWPKNKSIYLQSFAFIMSDSVDDQTFKGPIVHYVPRGGGGGERGPVVFKKV